MLDATTPRAALLEARLRLLCLRPRLRLHNSLRNRSRNSVGKQIRKPLFATDALNYGNGSKTTMG